MIYRFIKDFYPGVLPFSQCVCVLRKKFTQEHKPWYNVLSVTKEGES